MTDSAWAGFCVARERYRKALARFGRGFRGLRELQQRLVDGRSGPAYTVERALVYNRALDELGPADEIRLILVGDNPGRREQAAQRYLVGPSGKIAEGFFRATPELGLDLRRNILILNKTPVHTPRTAELAELCRLGGPKLAGRIAETQRFMASLLLEFQRALSGP
ncbi:MAG: uracil-DNA glycosylase family protein, partial [Treponema sp.]|nr:uracil-DNA glycosylase family protein [Treponema sp.]